jgi:adenine-specific DNA-methyltransferase
MPKGLQPTLFLTDPPYNIGHPYGDVDDRRPLEAYHALIRDVMCAAYEVAAPSAHFFMIHYPEALASMWDILTNESGWTFHQWITWIYPSNIGMSNSRWTRGSRAILWLQKSEEGPPPFYPTRIVQPYRNPWDKRVSALMAAGKMGCHLNDWWKLNLVKNVNEEKSDYANQIPGVLLERIIRSTTDVGDLVVDPFGGTFSTVKAALRLGRLGWGCDLNKNTRAYWPDGTEYNPDYVEEEQLFDAPMTFDHVRAGISDIQYKRILRHGIQVLKDKKEVAGANKLEAELKRMGWLD